MSNALGLAMCKGANRGLPSSNHLALCHRSAMCPYCERQKAKRRAYGIAKRIEAFDEKTDGDFSTGVLVLTLPGVRHESQVRFEDLRGQYEYMTRRCTLPGLPSEHSMRGMNRLLTDLGADGGTHFLEWSYNSSKEWWNLHMNSLFWGYEELDVLRSSARTVFPEGYDLANYGGPTYHSAGELLGVKSVGKRQFKGFEKLGFGKIYSLDYAEDHEMESKMRYASKVAYATKPFVAPLAKKFDIADFLSGADGGKLPRLARPFGSAQKSLEGPDMKEWMTEFPKNYRYLWQRSRDVA